MSSIKIALEKQFSKHRIVFWYDIKNELREEFEALQLDGVEKVEIKNNQFGLKYRVLREDPEVKILLYHAGPPPENKDNWLLDIQLAQGQFKADQVSLWLSELGLGPEYWEIADAHQEFFRAKDRREKLVVFLDGNESKKDFELKMLAVAAGVSQEVRFDSILENLLAEEAQDSDDRMHLIQRCSLEVFFWEELATRYGYQSENPDMRDFSLKFFQTSYLLPLDEAAPLPATAAALMNRWKDSLQHQEAFEDLSEEYAELLDIKKDLLNRTAQDLVGLDIFRLIDQKILSDLVGQVVDKTISAAACEKLVWERHNTHWYGEFEHIYQAIHFGAMFLDLLEKTELSVKSLEDGFNKYLTTWYQLDQYYRKCIYHARTSKQVSLLETLLTEVQKHYSNTYLLEVNNRWQEVLDKHQVWEIPGQIPQEEFFEHFVQNKFLADDKKLVVIISDALRYEIGVELAELVCQEDRYEAELEAMVGVLPSATAFGMAALLPHEKLTYKSNGSVFADEISTQGIQNRGKVLENYLPNQTKAIQAADLLTMNREQSRALFRDHQLIYIYHNQIDALGDDRATEDQVFKAVEDTLVELMEIIKKMTAANATNILVTADHGFLYQNETLEENEFVHLEQLPGEIFKQTRRWMLGAGDDLSERLKHYRPEDLGFEGETDLYLAKSINRLRLQGAGSKYVHGGASLQEIVLPVVWINKKKASDLDIVEVDILGRASQIISTGQVSVSFYQESPVTAKCQPRTLRTGIYSSDGALISDSHQLTFDLTTEDKREREVKQTFVLSQAAENYNQQEVILKLEERIPRTDHYREYKSMRYQLQRPFTSDFDF